MIQTLVMAFRKHVRNQAAPDVVRERSENVPGFDLSAGCERESLQGDHRVAPPVGEPRITGDDGPHVVSGGSGAQRVLTTSFRNNNELIRGQNQFSCQSLWRNVGRSR